MAIPLVFHELELRTETGISAYRFKNGLNVVSGDYSTGKSSMFELIKFALGSRSAELMPDIIRNLKSATLDVTIGAQRVKMTRMIGSNSVSVVSRNGLDEVWTATQGSRPRAAIRILELMQFPVTRLAKRSGAASEPLTFFDLYRYVYLPQANVNSSVAGHADRMIDRKRRAIFEIAYGLVDDGIRNLEVKASELKRIKDETSKAAIAVQNFMAQTGTPERSELEDQEAAATVAFAEAEARLTQARDLGRGAFSGDQSSLRERIGSLRTAAADLEAELLALEISVEKGRALVAQLELDEEGEIRSRLALGSLSGLEFAKCPRCLQSVREKDVPAGHCLLCGQSQDLARSEVDPDESLSRLRGQRMEAEQLVAEDEQRLHLVMRELATVRGDLNDVAGQLEQQAEPDRLLPSLDMSTEAAGAREIARARLRDIERYRDLWFKYGEMLAEVSRLQDEIEKCDREVARRREALEANRSRVTDLSTVFDHEIRELGFAGYERAWVDGESFLPVINGDVFDKLSVSGARKTLANVTYYLANLSMALNDSEILMPSAVILDSPRTSLGNTSGDVLASWQVYYRMHVLALASPTCQLIVADNGLPSIRDPNMRRAFIRATNIIDLSYDQPLLKDVPHPGRGKVETVGSRLKSERSPIGSS